jgi:deltex-like protein
VGGRVYVDSCVCALVCGPESHFCMYCTSLHRSRARVYICVCVAGKESFSFKVGRSRYRVDLSDASEFAQSNESSGFQRQVRRVTPGDAEDPSGVGDSDAESIASDASSSSEHARGGGGGGGGGEFPPLNETYRPAPLTGSTPKAADGSVVLEPHIYTVATPEELKSERCAVCMCDLDEDDAAETRAATLAAAQATGGAAGAVAAAGVDVAAPESEVVHLVDCPAHFFHRECIEQAFAFSKKCPVCGAAYGKLRGTMPDGVMDVRSHAGESVAGHPDVGTIVIQYHFPNGIQGDQHPNPGKQYWGTGRTAFLPDNAEGREVLALLRAAFEQRFTFTIGTSITTGQSDCVVWNGIHHKTSPHGGTWGWPDPTYLSRVKEELMAFGIK